MVKPLAKNTKMEKRKGPVMLVIMDGVGYGKYEEGDGFKAALTPNLDALMSEWPTVSMKAHGTAVGLPSDDDMGNSEVGHNAIGCGRVFAQGAKLVSNSIASGAMFEGDTWKKLTGNCAEKGSTMHFIGLLSDGNVHSHIDHLKQMIIKAKEAGVKKVRVHALLDGRDVGETSALEYFDPFEDFCRELSTDGFSARIASGGGRMVITMDRYGANWNMVKLGWETHVLGEGRSFANPHEAIETLRAETEAIDQDLPPFVIAEDGKAVGTVEDGDAVVFFNFRGDRALEITKAFEAGDDFSEFDRKRCPSVEYAGMMEYDGDLHIPAQYLVSPPAIDRTMGEYLAASGVKSFAISETQKYGHVTYFFNGNKLGKFDEKLETFEEILSDVVPFEQRPWMKCADITDRVLEVVESGEYDFIRMNFPNGDMVGHTGVFPAVVCSMEALDLCIGRLKKAVEAAGGVMIVSADHGNSDDMYEHDKKTGAVKTNENGKPKAKTAHSLNPVPCIVYDPAGKGEYKTELKEGLGISSLAATTLEFLGFEAPEGYDSSVLNYK
ncbi:MAG: 2,3-bisphosphoglycerate-independent phosphoglycerate mutase [Spirochaetales bacterium]|uniref:2,3-bisphosphoglycerate-independent phosphoglycerate mutase n=1 Tax=Candidatus Thalassospirochaeta sargassi TaxID=3119039 RepID=A0AAJ1MIZ2_9SPIO|nr:2,3-bisphosphoglycerate-independent phosphoglycerate mutase [Spirochaetales bacterium]